MDKRNSDQPDSQEPGVAGSTPEKIETPLAATEPPAEGLSKIEAPALVPAAFASVTAETVAPPPAPVLPPVSPIDAPKVEAAASAPPVAPPAPTKAEPINSDPIPLRTKATSAAAASWAWLKMHRVTPLAASIAVAAVVGAMAGSVATAGLGGLWASPPPAETVDQTADLRPLRDTIARINTELAALKASIENSGRTANAQFTKLGDRLDRFERAQAEPAAKLAKLTEAVNRLDHRAPVAAGNDVTGSIAAPALAPQPAGAPPVRPNPPILEGWVVRGVYNGAALIQARYGGVIEVEPGDNLPQLGRIENIRRLDGRWVVVTSRGMIVAR